MKLRRKNLEVHAAYSILIVVIVYLLSLPIRPGIEPSPYLFTLYVFSVIWSALIGLLFLVLDIASSGFKTKLVQFFIPILMLFYLVGNIFGALGGGGSLGGALILVLLCFFVSTCGFRVGWLLADFFRAHPRRMVFAIIFIIIALGVIIVLDGNFDSFLGILTSRYLILQSALLLLILIAFIEFAILRHIYKYVIVSLIAGLIFMTGSRSFLGASLVYILFFGLRSIKNPNASKIFSVLTFTLFCGLMLFNISDYDFSAIYGMRAERGFFYDESREIIRNFYWEKIINDPISYMFGVGSDMGSVDLRNLYGDLSEINSPHNSYLFMLSSIGVVGSGVLLLFLVKMLSKGRSFPFGAFIIVYSYANDLLLFPTNRSQFVNMLVFYIILGIYAKKYETEAAVIGPARRAGPC